ncbi:MAG: acetolactate synthase small subunit [Hadesarchaea archaeon]|nr:acetolactate synthase small subunit [Hadesarchaea archaeon]
MGNHVFSVLCKNEPGVMMRISRAFMRRQVNMDSITVGIEPSGNARIIVLFEADERMADFLRRVLNRLTQVIEVEPIEGETSIVREIALVKTKQLEEEKRGEVLHQIEGIGGRVLEVKEDAIIAEIHGHHDRIERVLDSLGSEVIEEVARSGQVYISREFE